MIDLLMMGASRAEMAAWLRAQGIYPSTDDQGNATKGGGLTFDPKRWGAETPEDGERRVYAGSWLEYNGGALITAPRTVRATRTIDRVQTGKAGFAIPQAPAWLKTRVILEKDGETVGTYDRTVTIQEQLYAAFDPAEGVTFEVGQEMDIVSPEERLDNRYCVSLRITGEAAQRDEDDPEAIEAELDADGVTDPEDRDARKGKAWYRSKLFRRLRSVSTRDDVAGIKRLRVTGQQIWFFDLDEVMEWQRSRGIPPSVWL